MTFQNPFLSRFLKIFMSSGHSSVCELLNDIRIELEKQINANQSAPQMGELLKLTNVMPNRLLTSGLPPITIDSLQTLADSIYAKSSTQESLRSHLINVNQFIKKLCSTNP